MRAPSEGRARELRELRELREVRELKTPKETFPKEAFKEVPKEAPGDQLPAAAVPCGTQEIPVPLAETLKTMQPGRLMFSGCFR